MNELQIFKNDSFGEIRTLMIDGEPWFVGKDVAEALGYAEPRSAVSKKVEECDRGVAEMETPRGKQNMTTINESGLYALIFGSKLESAKQFKKWVTSEVLPTIRKTGGYVSNDDLFVETYMEFADDETKALFATTLQTIRSQNKKLKEQQSKIQEQKEIISGLTDDIDIYTKRNIINRVCKKRCGKYAGRYITRYKELYKCFLETYHVDLENRCLNYNEKQTKKKDQLSTIKYAEKFDHINDLFACCIKLYECDVNDVARQILALQQM